MQSSSCLPSDHRLPPTWTCDQCQTSFSQSQLLVQHTQEMKHAGYRCAALGCGKTFRARTSWLSHKKGHTAARTACSKCSKLFKRKDHCREHELICGKHKRATSNQLRLKTPHSMSRLACSTSASSLENTWQSPREGFCPTNQSFESLVAQWVFPTDLGHYPEGELEEWH